MHIVVGQPEFDIAQQAVENGASLLPGELAAPKRGSGLFAVSKVLHEECVLGVGNGLGNVCSRTIEGRQDLELVVDPHTKLHLSPETTLLLDGAAYLPVGNGTPLLIDRVIFEAAMITRTIDLGCQQFRTG